MSEDEIITNVKRIIEYKVISNYINNNDSRAIQGLLDLYQKEKEKNFIFKNATIVTDLENDGIKINMKADDLVKLYLQEKEKNEELNKLKGFEMLDIFNMGKESSRQRIKYDWVEKEKIREKLKEEQERLKAGFGKMYEESLGNSATRILQELLEENNGKQM